MKTKTSLEQFREELYQIFECYPDATMELLDALASQTHARSVAELSLEAVFRREYSSVYKAIACFFQASETAKTAAKVAQERRQQAQLLLSIIAKRLEKPGERQSWLFGIDATSNPRQFARTLPDRGFVYQANMLKGNKPVTIGHQYSILAQLPARLAGAPPWVVPLTMRRVRTAEKEVRVAAEHLDMLMGSAELPWHGQLSVVVADSKHSQPAYLYRGQQHPNLVTITRARNNRTLHQLYQGPQARGPRRSFGERFSLNEPSTWHPPAEKLQFEHTSRRGRNYQIEIRSWQHMLMHGTLQCAMRDHPFTLVQIIWYDQHGQVAFERPIWLIVMGQRRAELALKDIWQAYAQRYDLEHFIRFGKQRLLLTRYQTPDTAHEENWWQLVQLAYVQLYLARELASKLPRPWERYLPVRPGGVASPSQTQRDFRRIIRQFGTPAKPPKPRGISPGRVKGARPPPRPPLDVVRKGKKGKKPP